MQYITREGMTMATRNADLMMRLTNAQNHPALVDRDVMTIVAYFETREELESHVLACERRIARTQG